MLQIGVLASHNGTTLQAVLDACSGGQLQGRVAAVISNNSGSGALRRARVAGVPSFHFSTKTHAGPGALDRAIRDALLQARVDIVLLAGYMKKLGPEILGSFPGRIINTHPSLLPKFGGVGMYGQRVHEAVLAAGESESGATVHVVDGDYDTGPIVAQCVVPVKSEDTPDSLAERVQAGERSLLIRVLGSFADGSRVLPVAHRASPASR